MQAGGLQLRQRHEHAAQVRFAAAAADELPDRLVVDNQPDAVALAEQHVRNRCREQPRVCELRHAVGPGEPHRPAGVDGEVRDEIRRLAELLRVEAIGPREELPVDVLQVVAGTIVAVLAELRAVAVKRAPVQTGDGAVDGDAGDQLEIRNRRQHLRVERPRDAGHRIRSSS